MKTSFKHKENYVIEGAFNFTTKTPEVFIARVMSNLEVFITRVISNLEVFITRVISNLTTKIQPGVFI